MKKHRVFIAINLPEKTKNRIEKIKDGLPDLPGRFTKRASLHLTLAFLGYLDDEQICSSITNLNQLSAHDVFDLEFNHLGYGPLNQKEKKPRMIWLYGPQNQKLVKLKTEIEEAVSENWYRKNNQKFIPHITLMRLKGPQTNQLPELEQSVRISFPVKSFELMESELKKDGAQYHVLESFSL